MNINVLSVLFLVGISLQGAAVAATIPVATNSAPSIESRDAHSRFLEGAYTPGQALSDDGFPETLGSSPAGSTDAQRLFESKTTQSLTLPQTSSDFTPSSDSFIKTSDLVPTRGRATQGFDGLSTAGLGGAPSLSTVPLPASAPLFGAALVILGAVGHRLRGRASRRV